MLPVTLSHSVLPCGLFGSVRKFDRHAGVDLYCAVDEVVKSLFAGKVIDVFQFTGASVGTVWWNDTWAVLVRHKDVDILYGEIIAQVAIGQSVLAGDIIGKVTQVLKKDKGVTPTSMLHLEVWEHNTFIKDFVWQKEADKPTGLLDPVETLKLSIKL